MSNVVLSGNFLRSARGLTIKDGGGVTWSFSSTTNELSVSGLSGTAIAADSVSNTELANMAQSTIKGRAAAAGTGDPTDLTAAQVKTILALASTDLSDFTEAAQDSVLNAGTDSTTIDFTYNDGANTWTVDVIDDSVSNAKMRNSAALSVIGRDANSIGDPGDITSSSNDTLLRRTANTLNWGQLTVGMFPASVITYAKIQDISATSRVLGRITASAGVVEELTGANLATIIGTSLGANPSASVGLSAVNGTAGTYLRSDAAPALSQAITPTWTGTHAWSFNADSVATAATFTNSSGGTSNRVRIYLSNGTNDLIFYLTGTAFSGALLTSGPTGQQGAIVTDAAIPLVLGANNIAAVVIDGSANTKIVGQAGFNNTAPIAKPAITGSRGGNAALASLLTALANYGLITDTTTA